MKKQQTYQKISSQKTERLFKIKKRKSRSTISRIIVNRRCVQPIKKGWRVIMINRNIIDLNKWKRKGYYWIPLRSFWNGPENDDHCNPALMNAETAIGCISKQNWVNGWVKGNLPRDHLILRAIGRKIEFDLMKNLTIDCAKIISLYTWSWKFNKLTMKQHLR
jgi:hypothetical protein